MKKVFKFLIFTFIIFSISACMLEYDSITPRPYYYRPLDIYPLYHDYYYPSFHYHYHSPIGPSYNPPPKPNIHYGPRHR